MFALRQRESCEAQAQLGITRADQLPTISGGASAVNERNRTRQNFFLQFETSANQVDLSLAWELDFWGKYRRATESARATLLATEWAREAVTSTLVSDVATAYFQLRALDLQLEISRRTLASRQDSLQLTQTLANGGATSMLDVRQAEQLVSTAAETIPDLERQIEQQENFLSTLLGNNPGPIARGMKLTEQPHAPEVPAGLPSSLLERRPDIRAGRSTVDRGQRSNWSSEGSVLPANQLDRDRWISEFSTYQPVHRVQQGCGVLEGHWYSPSSPGEGFVPVSSSLRRGNRKRC